MKRLLSMILALSIVLTIFGSFGITVSAASWNGTDIAAGFAGGDGTEANPYLIATAAELAYFSQQINAGSGNTAYYKLVKNIDLNSKNWTDAGTGSNRFKGTFDGNGKIIKNLSITLTAVDQVTGLFGYVENAVIKNLGMENVNISLSANATVYVGAIAGYSKNATIENCFVRGASLARTGSATGLIGGVLGQVGSGSTVTLTNCYVIDASLSSNDNIATYLGGLVGDANTNNTAKLNLTNCYVADLTLTSTNGNKGIITQKTVTSATNVYADSDKIADTSYANFNLNKTASDILTALGADGAFVADSENVNNAFPVLKWEIVTKAISKMIMDTSVISDGQTDVPIALKTFDAELSWEPKGTVKLGLLPADGTELTFTGVEVSGIEIVYSFDVNTLLEAGKIYTVSIYDNDVKKATSTFTTETDASIRFMGLMFENNSSLIEGSEISASDVNNLKLQCDIINPSKDGSKFMLGYNVYRNGRLIGINLYSVKIEDTSLADSIKELSVGTALQAGDVIYGYAWDSVSAMNPYGDSIVLNVK